MIITIDGPAGSGKSTAARNLAASLGVSFLDTGATYRAVTLRALLAGDDLSDAARLAEHARQMDIQLIAGPDGLRVRLDGRDVTEAIRAEKVSRNAHYVANAPEVRQVLVDLQRRIGRQLGDFVTEGRDQGTVVFPEADLKFYLDADPAERARRRCKELAQRGEKADDAEVLSALVARDERDRTRAVAPLCAAEGAIRLDTTHNTIEQTLQQMLAHVQSRAARPNEKKRT
jgi:cytidylate kinase